ncbi:MAG: LPS export ABC transporter periplasmic protein LptC [Bacteroidaceae bacterium]|nr:LPS export ABC transporter periplasmic protein LptC [Bacteroidaceae bacterium]
MKSRTVSFLFLIHSIALLLSCSQAQEHFAPAVDPNDSLPFMTSHGISNLISDSGIISYKIVAEDWDIYTSEPQRWTFLKGLFMEKFDSTFHVEWHVQGDTAYCHENRIWELRGRVVILNREGTLFRSEEFFWDMDAHLIWSDVFVRITTPEREIEGTCFRSNEEMTDWYFDNAAGAFPVSDTENPQADSLRRPQTDKNVPAPKSAPPAHFTTPQSIAE